VIATGTQTSFEPLFELVPNPKTEFEDEFEHEYD
jgi:hypothetical protein